MSFFWIIVSLFHYNIYSSVVTSSQGLPFAAINENQQVLAVGDIKTWILWSDESNIEERYAITHLNSSKRMDYEGIERFTGGIASQTSIGSIKAIACSQIESKFYKAQRSLAHPNGEWFIDSRLHEFEGMERQCAMLKDGTMGIFLPKSKETLLIKNVKNQMDIQRLQMNALNGDKFECIAAGDSFLVLSNRGEAIFVFQQDDGKDWILSKPLIHPFVSYSFSSTFRMAATKLNAIISNDEQVFYVELANPKQFTDAYLFKSKQQVFVNPCGKNQICLPFISQRDASWVISGLWGHYIGKSTRYIRLTGIPMSVSREVKVSGVALAHSGISGRFIYLGNDDGDIGYLRPTDIPTQEMTDLYDSNETQDPLYPSIIQTPFKSPLQTSLTSTPWWSEYLNVSGSWAVAKEFSIVPEQVTVAIVDSGSILNHSFLKSSFYENPYEIPNNGLDDENDGFIDDVNGFDFVNEMYSPTDTFGHGTHVSGILAGYNSDSNIYLSPAAKNIKLIVVRALNRYGFSNSIDLARALYFAAKKGAEVINCSWGGGSDTQALRDAFAYLKDQNITVFSSAGNNHLNTDKGNQEVPKIYPGVISIGAIDAKGNLAKYSNYGPQTVSFLAPGDQILSTTKDGQFGIMSGSSMASPMAASSFTFLYGLAKSLNQKSLKKKNLLELKEFVLDILCQTSLKSRYLSGLSQCGSIQLEKATRQLILSFANTF